MAYLGDGFSLFRQIIPLILNLLPDEITASKGNCRRNPIVTWRQHRFNKRAVK